MKKLIISVFLISLIFIISCNNNSNEEDVYFIPCSDYIMFDSSETSIEIALFFFEKDGTRLFDLDDPISYVVYLVGGEKIGASSKEVEYSVDSHNKYSITSLYLEFDLSKFKKERYTFNEVSIYDTKISEYRNFSIGKIILSRLPINQTQGIFELKDHPVATSNESEYPYDISIKSDYLDYDKLSLVFSEDKEVLLNDGNQDNSITGNVKISSKKYPVSYVRPAVLLTRGDEKYYKLLPYSHMGIMGVDEADFEIAKKFYMDNN